MLCRTCFCVALIDGAVDDDDVAGIDLRVLGLPAADRGQVEGRRLPLPADRPEYRHPARIGVLARALGHRHRLDQADRARDRERTAFAHRAVDGHRPAPSAIP